jgi:hypothetical protein
MFFLGRCVTWIMCPLDNVSLYEPSLAGGGGDVSSKEKRPGKSRSGTHCLCIVKTMSAFPLISSWFPWTNELFRHQTLYVGFSLKVDLLMDSAALYLTYFIDWRYIHSWLVFSTQLVNWCPHGWSNCTCVQLPFYLLSDLPPFPN